jgi:nickel-dependent lactate racemase
MVQYIVATGTHNPTDERNLKIKSMITDVASDLDLDFDVDINTSREAERFGYVGATTRGTEVRANRKALDADIFVAAADMKPHYFAGYSAANKHFLPGISEFNTVRVNHCGLIKDERSNYGRHPWHYNEQRRENPLVADMLEAMDLIVHDRPVYALAMINDGDILWTQFGPIEAVTRAGIKRADEIYSFTTEPVRRLVASPGGSPYDSYLYTGIRTMELTLEAVEQGGEVLWLSECAEGIHTGITPQVIEDFYSAMKLDLDTLSEELDHPDVKFHAYKAYRFKRLFEKIRIYGYSGLSDEILKSVDIEPVSKPQEVIDAWLQDNPNDRILFVDKANKLAVYGNKH